MSIDLTGVRRELFGISFLEESQSAAKQWQARFRGDHAFWMEADANTRTEQIVLDLTALLDERNIRDRGGRSCVVALFVDGTQQLSEQIQAVITELAGKMRSVLNYSVDAQIQFCDMGKVGLGSRQVQRDNVRTLMGLNTKTSGTVQTRNCMVAQPVRGAERSNHWKAVMVYLDLLRRESQLGELMTLPDHNMKLEACPGHVGFLGYEEFNQEERAALQERKEQLQNMLGKGGEEKFRTLVVRKREELIAQGKDRFKIHPELHPIHPDMVIPEPTGIRVLFGNPRTAAARGTNEKFKEAARLTREAVVGTAQCMEDEIGAWLSEEAKQAPETLKQWYLDAGLSIAVKRKGNAMHNMLNLISVTMPEDPPLSLAYNPDGYDEAIREYLTGCRDQALASGLEKVRQALLAEYDATTVEQWDEEEETLKMKKGQVEEELENCPDVPTICRELFVEQHGIRECQFSTTLPATIAGMSQSTVLLAQGEEMDRILESVSTGGARVKKYYIRHPGGGIAQPDPAPMKALTIQYAQGNDKALEWLLSEG